MERYNFINPLFLFKIESMVRCFFMCFFLVFLTTCDDGDIFTVDLDFDKELERCTNDNASYLIYDLREDPNESLSLIIPRSTDYELLFTSATTEGLPVEIPINTNTVRFNYRTYNRPVVSSGTNQELCDVIQPASLNIVEDYEATSGKVFVTTTIEDDDNDGVPTEFEGRGELDGNGEYSNALDTDGDLIPDYLDDDDDGDNVKTSNEIDNSDGDDDPTTDPMDTDGDGTLDYLDEDDDDDTILTRLEDENGMNGPGDDTANNADGNLVPHYKNIEEATPYDFENYDAFENMYTRTVKTSFIIEDIELEILRTTIIDFGTLITILPDYSPPTD